MALLAVGLVSLAVQDALQQRERERALRDEVALDAVLGVDAVSQRGSGAGRVDHYAAVLNLAPHRVRVMAVHADTGRLRLRGRPVAAGTAEQGRVVYVPLSVHLDCSREGSLDLDRGLPGTVDVVTGSGRRVRSSVVLLGADPLTTTARTLCRLHPTLVVELSGRVR